MLPRIRNMSRTLPVVKIPPKVPPDKCCQILPVEGPELDEPRCCKPAIEWWQRDGRYFTSLCEDCAPRWRQLKIRPTYRKITYDEALVLYIHSQ